MSAPRKYDQEFRDRAVRMYRDRLAEAGESKLGAESRLYKTLRGVKGPGARESDSDVRSAVVDAIAATSGDVPARRILWVDDWPGNNAALTEAMRSRQIHVDIALSRSRRARR